MNNLKLTITGKEMVADLIEHLDAQTEKKAIREEDYDLRFDDKGSDHLGGPETVDLILKSVAVVVPIVLHFLNQRIKKKEQRIKVEYETLKDGVKVKISKEFLSEKELTDFLTTIESK